MKVSLIELSTPTHYSAVNGLIKSYLVKDYVEITVYCNLSIYEALKECDIPQIVNFEIFNTGDFIGGFLKNAVSEYDRIHFCTIDRYYYHFSVLNISPTTEIFFHLHNIDFWFSRNRVYAVEIFKSNFHKKPIKAFFNFFREYFINYYFKQRFLSNIQLNDYRFIIHSSGQKKYLSNFIDDSKIIVFPFAIFEKKLSKNVDSNINYKRDFITIGIPGIITNDRRDYQGLFKFLLENSNRFSSFFRFDLLGYLPKDQSKLEQQINKLIKIGYNIQFQNSFLKVSEFERRLKSCDILLNNLNVIINKSSKYGETKESGIIFNMIRSSKLAVIPSSYDIDIEMGDCVIKFSSYSDLKNIFEGIQTGLINLEKYKLKLERLSFDHSPEVLINRLIIL